MSLSQTSAPNAGATPALAPGFADPVHDAQSCFRAVMSAMARPGATQPLNTCALTPPAPLTATAAAIVLTLCDYDTPLWLDRPLMQSEPVKAFLRFHTGAPIVSEPVEAAFALFSHPAAMVPLASFNQGSPEYPDRSTTLILTGQDLNAAPAVTLDGPGLKTPAPFGSGPVPPVFWDQVAANTRQFPRGVDLIFAGTGEIAALPRSTRTTPLEA